MCISINKYPINKNEKIYKQFNNNYPQKEIIIFINIYSK